MLLVSRGQYFLLLSGFHGTLSILPFYQRGQGVRGACMVPAELRVEEADEVRPGEGGGWAGVCCPREISCVSLNESWGTGVLGSGHQAPGETCGLGVGPG